MMKKMLVLLAFVVMSGEASASQSVKVGVVDLQRAVSESKEGMAARADLLKKTEQLNADLKIMLAEIDKSRAELEKESSKLSVEERSDRGNALQKKGRDFQNRQREAQEEIKQVENDLLKRLIAKLRLLMAKLGEDENYSVILDRSAGVFFAGKEIDITAQLIEKADGDYGKR